MHCSLQISFEGLKKGLIKQVARGGIKTRIMFKGIACERVFSLNGFHSNCKQASRIVSYYLEQFSVHTSHWSVCASKNCVTINHITIQMCMQKSPPALLDQKWKGNSNRCCWYVVKKESYLAIQNRCYLKG
jgi:hypothetical protein